MKSTKTFGKRGIDPKANQFTKAPLKIRGKPYAPPIPFWKKPVYLITIVALLAAIAGVALM